MEPLSLVFYVIILIISVIIHELAHGIMADRLGDPTPRMMGRLTLNPLKHLDLWGSVLVPLFLIFSHVGMVVGWAKPVPFNLYNIKNKRWGPSIIAIVGPLSNVLIAIIFGLLLRFLPSFGVTSEPLFVIFSQIVLVNLVLAVFNLIPVPPLDGHHILFSFLSAKFNHFKRLFNRYSIVVLLVILIFLWKYVAIAVFFFYNVIVGTVPVSF